MSSLIRGKTDNADLAPSVRMERERAVTVSGPNTSVWDKYRKNLSVIHLEDWHIF